jgi:hypothetical protein
LRPREPQGRSRQCLFHEQADELIPYIGTLLAVAPPTPLEQRIRALDSHAVGLIFRATLLIVRKKRTASPPVVAFEDWHWADASSASLPEHLLPTGARSCSSSRAAPNHKGRRVVPDATSSQGIRRYSTRAFELVPLSVADTVSWRSCKTSARCRRTCAYKLLARRR